MVDDFYPKSCVGFFLFQYGQYSRDLKRSGFYSISTTLTSTVLHVSHPYHLSSTIYVSRDLLRNEHGTENVKREITTVILPGSDFNYNLVVSNCYLQTCVDV